MSFPTYSFDTAADSPDGSPDPAYIIYAEHINELRRAIEELSTRPVGGTLTTEDDDPILRLLFPDTDFSASYDPDTDTQTISLLASRIEAIVTAMGIGGGGVVQPFYETFDVMLTNASVAAPTANQAVLVQMPKLPVAKTFSEISTHIGTASGNIDLGAYTTTDFSTFTRVASTGSVAAAGTNANQSIALSYTIPADTAWYQAIVADNATITLLRLASSSPVVTKALNKRLVHKAASFPLPSTLSGMAESNMTAFWVSSK